MTEIYKNYIIEQGSVYWPKNKDMIYSLPISSTQSHKPDYKFKQIKLPNWAEDLGDSEGFIWVDSGYILATNEKTDAWLNIDWFSYAFYLLNGLFEQKIENHHGAQHSYSHKLKEIPAELWEYAWVNRIFLFLRRWAAKEHLQEETSLFGPKPTGEIILTHDVDALRKTLSIRFKQSAFHLFNSLKALTHGDLKICFNKIGHSIRFLISSPSYLESFEWMLNEEKERNVKSTFFFYGDQNNSMKKWLFDPNYTLEDLKYKNIINNLKNGGWRIGLHQSYEAWENSDLMQDQKSQIEKAINGKIDTCRQHWLKFSWEKTWKAQRKAGFKEDFTLGFNDRTGFRNSSALSFHPWNSESNSAHDIKSTPMILMDSHLYDYKNFTHEQRKARIKQLIDEVLFVGGQASIIWHPHTCAPDYGWRKGYIDVLDTLK